LSPCESGELREHQDADEYSVASHSAFLSKNVKQHIDGRHDGPIGGHVTLRDSDAAPCQLGSRPASTLVA
jgi:hypothetical protein